MGGRKRFMSARRRSGKAVTLALGLLLFIVAGPASAQLDPPCEKAEDIGVASMTADGVITLRLRSLPPGPIAEATMRYTPGDPKYEEVMTHLGGIAPGETKAVRPWC